MKKNSILLINTENGIFEPIYTYTDEKPILDEDGNIIDWELVDYIETMTAQEHYTKWLLAKENPPVEVPDQNVILEEEVKTLKEELVLTNQYLTELELYVLENQHEGGA